MFAEAFHSMIMGIHLALEVKTSVNNSMPTMGSTIESSSQKPGVPTDSYHRHHRKREKKKHVHQKVTKQSLSDYAQQDSFVMTKWSNL
jgi:hypothetical protein